MKIILKGDEKLKVVDYSKKPQSRPAEFPWGYELPVVLEFYHDNGGAFTEAELSIYTSFQFGIDKDFDFTTEPPALANNSTTAFVISGNTISFILMTDSALLKALIGDNPSARAYAELKGYLPGKTRPALKATFAISLVNAVLADGSAVPAADPQLYITFAEAYALVHSAPIFEFSIDGATLWHTPQVSTDRYYREQRNGGEWSEAIALIDNSDFSGYATKAAIVDNDTLLANDSEDSGKAIVIAMLKIWNYINIKAASVYAAIVHSHAIGDVTGLSGALDDKEDSLGFTPENSANKGSVNGYAELDSGGKVPSAQLPAYVDDVIEVANFAALPGTGESGKIYVTIDDNITYRWSGSTYTEISASLALGETLNTAYRGDRGKIAYDHSQSAHSSGDVVGPASSTDNAIVRFDTATGKLVQGSLLTITDAGKMTFPDIATTGIINATKRSAEPSAPASGDIYLDDGTNTASTAPGWRRYTGTAWEDIGVAGKLIVDGDGYALNNGSVGRGTTGLKALSMGYSSAGTNYGATSAYTVVSGGDRNIAGAGYATCSGGNNNGARASYSTVSGGAGNSAWGSGAVISGGLTNNSTGAASTIPGGVDATSDHYGEHAISSGKFSASGDCQRGDVQFRIATSATDEVELFLDGVDDQFTLTDNDAYTCKITMFGAQADGSIGEAVYQIKIKRQGATTSLSQSLQTILAWNADAGLGTPAFAITADDTNDALKITVTAANTTATRWTALLEYVRINY